MRPAPSPCGADRQRLVVDPDDEVSALAGSCVTRGLGNSSKHVTLILRSDRHTETSGRHLGASVDATDASYL